MILQKIAVLETKVQRTEVNVEVNGLCRNDTTVPWSQNSRQEPANTWLISLDNDSTKQWTVHCVINPGIFFLAGTLLVQSLKIQRPEICDATG